MKRSSLLGLYAFLAILTVCGLAAFLSGSIEGSLFIDPSRIWKRLIWPLLRLSFLISIGVFVALVIEGTGWTNRLAVVARPFMRWGHLSEEMGSVFTTAFLSGVTSLAMLATFLQEGTMNRKEVTLAVLLDTFPSFFMHLPTTFFILWPLVGKAGVIYLLLTFGAALLRLGMVIVYTHFSFPEPLGYRHEMKTEKRDWKGFLEATLNKLSSRLTRILLIVTPVYVIMLLLSDMGFFQWLRGLFSHGVSGTLIPVESMSVVILSLMAELTSGYAAAGAMLDSGTLTMSQTVLALVAGNILATPLRALRHQLPYYMGIFRPGMGIYLMAAGQVFRLFSLLAVAAVFVFVMKAFGQI